MVVSQAKKEEFWAALAAERRPPMLTAKRMEKLRALVWNDADFWNDIVARHGGMTQTPEELKERDPSVFEHCLGNFHGMLCQTLLESRLR